MKKLYTFCFASLFLAPIAKPQYAPLLSDTTEWCLALDVVLLIQQGESRFTFTEQHFYAEDDTVIGSNTYKEIYDLSNTYQGALRDDTTGKVWAVPPGLSVEQLLYDFSMNMGDSIYLDYEIGSQTVFNDGYYFVDSVAVMQTHVGPRKYLRLHNPANVTLNVFNKIPKLEWVEGIGGLEAPLYLFHESMVGTGSFGILAESCNPQGLGRYVINKQNNGVKQYVRTCFFQNPVPGTSFGTDSCNVDYSGSVEELGMRYKPLFVFPNPSNGAVTLDLEKVFGNENHLRVFSMDVTGKKTEITSRVSVNRNEIVIPAQTLRAGIHVITVEGEKQSGMARVIITH